jgi:phosphoserine phosphatase
MRGNMDFKQSLTLRCAKLAGLKLSDLDEVYKRVRVTPGAKELIQALKKLGYKVALISGGFTLIARRLQQELGIDYAHANELEIVDGKLTGRVNPPIIDAQRKADLLEVIAQQEQLSLDQVIAVGDGANDLLMLERAGLGIAFNAKPVVSERADTALHKKKLSEILYLLGFSGREIERFLGN